MANKSAIVEIQVTADAADAMRDVGKAEAALKDLEQAARQAGSGASGINDLTDAVGQLEKATANAAQGAGGLSEAFAGGLAGGAIVEGISSLADGVKEAFSKVAEIGMDAFAKAMDFDVGRDKLQAQLGLTAEQSQKMGQLAGDLYSQAYGDSIGDVNDALRLVTLNVGLNADTQAAELQSVTGSVLDLASAFDQDLAGSTRAVGQLMRTGLAANAKDALDVITRGFQIGNDRAEDLLDTINEYSTSFRDVGLDAKQFMGILKQGLQGGARDADQVADAIKEFGIRAKDASATSAKAFEDLGLNAKDMTELFARGGKGAADGLDLVLDKLREMEDPVKKNQVAVGLFGTQSEDLAKALNSIDPSTAVAALGEVGGAADKMGQDLADNASTKFESWKRSVETNVVRFIADNVIPSVSTLGDHAIDVFGKMGHAWDAFVRGFRGPVKLAVDDGKLTSSISAIENMQPPQAAEGSFQGEMEKLGASVRQLSDEWLPKLRDALEEVRKKLEEMTTFARENKDVLELLRDIGVLGLIGALVVLGAIIGATSAAIGGLIIIVGLMMAPILLVIRIAKLMGFEWSGVWDWMTSAARGGTHVIGGLLDDLGHLLGTFVDNVWPDDWAKFWDNVTGIVRRAVDAVKGFLGDIKREIQNFLDLAHKIENPFSLPSFNLNMAPTGLVSTVGLSAAPAAAAMPAPTVINVNVSHTGLGVDSPRLQKDLVEALRRYERRNGRGSP